MIDLGNTVTVSQSVYSGQSYEDTSPVTEISDPIYLSGVNSSNYVAPDRQLRVGPLGSDWLPNDNHDLSYP